MINNVHGEFDMKDKMLAFCTYCIMTKLNIVVRHLNDGLLGVSPSAISMCSDLCHAIIGSSYYLIYVICVCLRIVESNIVLCFVCFVCFVCLRLVSFVPNVASFSGLPILGFSNVYLSKLYRTLLISSVKLFNIISNPKCETILISHISYFVDIHLMCARTIERFVN